MPNEPRRCIVCGTQTDNHKYCNNCLKPKGHNTLNSPENCYVQSFSNRHFKRKPHRLQ